MQVGHQELPLLHLSNAGQGPLPDDNKQSGAWEKQGDPMGPFSRKRSVAKCLSEAGLCCPVGS